MACTTRYDTTVGKIDEIHWWKMNISDAPFNDYIQVLQNKAMRLHLISGLGRRCDNAFYKTKKTELESILSRVFCATQSGRVG
jgi:hypothetical protein